MASNNSKLPLLATAAVLAAVIVVLGVYVGRLRWQNSFLRADVARLEARVAAAPTAPPPAPAATAASAVTGPRALTPEQRRAMVDKLNTEAGPQKDVWFVRAANNREAEAYQQELQKVFEEAGWKVRGASAAGFSLRPGVFFLMADASPPTYVFTALGAFGVAGIQVSSGRDYRAFNERKKSEDPSWRGFEMDAGQAYLIAVGPVPPEPK